MKSLHSLFLLIQGNIEAIYNDLEIGEAENLLPFLGTSVDYLLAPDLKKESWDCMCEEDRELFYLFVLSNEVYHYMEPSKNFLMNASIYFPKNTSVHCRLKLFSKLMKMNHIQNQYEKLVMEFLSEANKIYQIEDVYLNKKYIRLLLLSYFNTFMQRSRTCFSKLGQISRVEEILPQFVKEFNSNSFAMESVVDLITIIKGTYNKSVIKINLSIQIS